MTTQFSQNFCPGLSGVVWSSGVVFCSLLKGGYQQLWLYLASVKCGGRFSLIFFCKLVVTGKKINCFLRVLHSKRNLYRLFIKHGGGKTTKRFNQ